VKCDRQNSEDYVATLDDSLSCSRAILDCHDNGWVDDELAGHVDEHLVLDLSAPKGPKGSSGKEA
jgi:hypothetical protein